MQIILEDPDTGDLYKIEPFDNGLCYRIFRNVEHMKGKKTRNGRTVKNDWAFTEKYPTSIAHAVSLVLEMMLCNKNNETVIRVRPNGIKKTLSKYFEDMTQHVISSIKIKEK